MARTKDNSDDADDGEARSSPRGGRRRDPRLKDMGISCMLNTEVGSVLAVIRRTPVDLSSSGAGGAPSSPHDIADLHNSNIINSLKSLRSLLFHPCHPEWRLTNPSVYLAPFLDVVQSDDVPASATGVASAVLKILKLDVFDERTPGARDAVHSVIFAVTNCRLERTDPASEDAVMMRILQVTEISRVATHDEESLSGSDADDDPVVIGYGARCMVDVFHFLCSLLNVGEVVDDGGGVSSDEDVQVFALVLINSAIELGGEGIGKHGKLLGIIQDDLFHNLIHYATRSSPLVLSMICSTVLNLYQFLRRSLRLQLEAFFTYVLLKIASGSSGLHLQEVAVEGILGFCRQPTFIIEAYVNYDCDPLHYNVFEELGKLLCKTAFPLSAPMSPMQIQAFEGLVTIIRNIADGVETDKIPVKDSYDLDISEFKPFWTERCDTYHENTESWVDFVRMRKLKKKKIMVAANHYNRDEKKGLDYLKICQLVPTPPDPKSLAYFFRYTPGLDKKKIGDYLGDPDELNLKVLAQFTSTFDFSGVTLDTALRTYLESFRLPGESQKIQRILEAFSDQYYKQQSSDIFASNDAVNILCYSVIMLNTDQHNPQVKKKMTEEEFIRNNRSINGGNDLPREYLSSLFNSIATKAIAVLVESTGAVLELNANRWADLVKRARASEPFIVCDYKHKLSREVFVTISGPSVATLSAIFEQTDDEDILNECVDGMISAARIARYGLEDILDELLCCFCKFTTLLNPYATAEETLFTFTNEMKPKMATLAVFTIANKFGDAIRGSWKNLIDCLLKLKRLRLLPQSLVEPENASKQEPEINSSHIKTESGVIFPSSQFGAGGNNRNASGLMGKFSQFLSMDNGQESMLNVGSEFENNLKIIQQCRIGSIFTECSKLPDESLQNLGRSLIFAAGGKGQKFSTSVEEEETVGFCWDLITCITSANLHRFSTFWPQFHECLGIVSQFPLFSPCPFAEKAIIAFFKIAVKLLSSSTAHFDKTPEDLIFKTINATWKLDKDILDTCCCDIADSTTEILNDHVMNVQTMIGWKTLLHMLSITGRHPETFDQGVESLVKLMSNGTHVTRFNYPFCIETAFGFAALKIIPLETSFKILDLMAGSVSWLIQWHKSGYSLAANLFLKLAEALRKTSLVRREEIRNQAVQALRRCFQGTEELEFTPANCLACFNLVIFALVDDLHEKMLEYSRRENSVKEMRSMEVTLIEAMGLLVEVYLQFMVSLSQSPGFRTFWLGVLRRMDTCMKANMDEAGYGPLQEAVPRLLKKMLVQMKEKEILVQRDGDELWDITNIQIQWIAPQVKEELFPDVF
ncbi:uncharacterized protein A4U43_C08F6120 [Asparagus officinalis]|nr:uncharacterized protein A4U43_C08F6120 [Asparagus officinalis]